MTEQPKNEATELQLLQDTQRVTKALRKIPDANKRLQVIELAERLASK